MKEITVTCITSEGTQRWFRNSETGETFFDIVPTDPSQIRKTKRESFSATEDKDDLAVRLWKA